MKKNLLFGLAAAALVVLNAMAFWASAEPKPQLPIEFAGCYQTVSPCGYSSVLRENCTSRKTNHECTRNYYTCHNCNNGLIILTPIEKPLEFDPGEGPILPIDPVEPINWGPVTR